MPPGSAATLRRLGRRAIGCVLLGAILQYAVAITFGLGTSSGDAGRQWVIVSEEQGGAVCWIQASLFHSPGRDALRAVLWTRGSWDFSKMMPTWNQLGWANSGRSGESTSTTETAPPPWSRLNRLPSDPTDAYDPPVGWTGCIDVGCGWPTRSAAYFAVDSRRPQVQYDVRDGIVIANPNNARFAELPRVIPLRIIWSGATINTLIYSAALFVPLTVIPSTRQYLRRRAGHCVNCNYDLRATTTGACPECGAQV